MKNMIELSRKEKNKRQFNLAGYQVAKAEFFAHTREPAITVWENKIKFNMACLRKFPGVKYIQLLIHPGRIPVDCTGRVKRMLPIRCVGQTEVGKKKSKIAI